MSAPATARDTELNVPMLNSANYRPSDQPHPEPQQPLAVEVEVEVEVAVEVEAGRRTSSAKGAHSPPPASFINRLVQQNPTSPPTPPVNEGRQGVEHRQPNSYGISVLRPSSPPKTGSHPVGTPPRSATPPAAATAVGDTAATATAATAPPKVMESLEAEAAAGAAGRGGGPRGGDADGDLSANLPTRGATPSSGGGGGGGGDGAHPLWEWGGCCPGGLMSGVLQCGPRGSWGSWWSGALMMWRSTTSPYSQSMEIPLTVGPLSHQQQQPAEGAEGEVAAPLQPHVDVSWGPLAGHRVRKQLPLTQWTGPPTRVTVTCPEQLGNESFPVVIMFGGFMCKAKWYQGLVDRVVSWGYAVVQYDIEGLVDSAESAILDPLLQLISVRVREGDLPAALDLHRLAVLGHGRGGKLAAMHLAKDDLISTAVLLDPVDLCGDDGGGGGLEEEAGRWLEVVGELRQALNDMPPPPTTTSTTPSTSAAAAAAAAGGRAPVPPGRVSRPPQPPQPTHDAPGWCGAGAGGGGRDGEKVVRWRARLEGVAATLARYGSRSGSRPGSGSDAGTGPGGKVGPGGGGVRVMACATVAEDASSPREPSDPAGGSRVGGEVKQEEAEGGKTRPRKALGIVGAAVGTLIPPGDKYGKFWSDAAPGSRLLVLPQSGHLQFVDLDPVRGRLMPQLMNRVLGGGDSQDTVEVAAVFTAACLHEAFHEGPPGAANPFTWRVGHYQYMVTVKRELAEG
ncbi:hypothetical protein VOLCADRAFT_94199 [Volvox carteri f. nagariensis]|uniref:Chlorophyllase n=1 Tax=Volvox carteri f. nagariensis TaxID=3068 RepID=D8U4E3_VOLCA|nr:uncharacterized protein VOLCADRAFT_94199 [Volvox carteri f. nagariensis]EFJ45486.1 hypothetical protein VOLCADRAFT_94199 [Volvox carteri f. nagariensis]|eukprot:XP_002953513.1 hypothetical protein VOLCADRAFT_94199 [Volvox carteri f. nagariensis]